MDTKAKIVIYGLGLMGGSLGLALVRAGFSVSGWSRNPATVREAYQIGAITELPSSLAEALTGAKYVFVGTPVENISETIKTCLPLSAPGTIFSDLGSIKGLILEEVFSFLPKTHYFVAGHPMTGSEQQGISAADPFLYQNATYVMIEDPRTPSFALDEVMEILRPTGAHLVKLTADEHDRIVGMISHLPHLLASTLAKTAGFEEELHPGTLTLAAGGFRDTTRVATGSPELWEGIILGNKAKVLEAIKAFQKQLDTLKDILNAGDRQRLVDFLREGREIRLQIPAKNKGFLTLLHEMVVTVEDRPGAIEEVLHFLAKNGLNIKDIEILRVREGDGGTLKISLENSEAVERAIEILRAEGFKVRKR